MDVEDDIEHSKVCLVCGDRALSCNFGAITCESCKAFFRRNASKEWTSKCDGHCPITVETRSYCKKCRLIKCLEVGMNKSLILSDEQKKLRKQKILENKMKRGSHDIFPKVGIDDVLPKIGMPKLEALQIHPLNSMEGVNAFPPQLEPVTPNIKSDVFGNSFPDISFDNVMDLKEDSLEVADINGLQSQQQVFHRTDNVIRPHIVHNAPHMTLPTSQMVSPMDTAASLMPFNSQSVSTTPEVSNPSTATSDPGFAFPFAAGFENSDFAEESVNNLGTDIISEVPVVKNLKAPVSDTSDYLSSIPPGIKMTTSKVRQYIDEEINLDDLPDPILHPSYGSVFAGFSLDNEVFMKHIEQLRYATSTAYDNVRKKDERCPRDPSYVQIFNFSETSIKCLVTLAKNLEPFLDLSTDDQILLLKNSILEMMVLGSAPNYDHKLKGWKVADRNEVRTIETTTVKSTAEGKTLIAHYEMIILYVLSASRRDLGILILLTVLALFSLQGRAADSEIQDKSKVQEGYMIYAKVLEVYTSIKYPDRKNMMDNLLSSLNIVRDFSETYMQSILKSPLNKINPLLLEIFDLPLPGGMQTSVPARDG